MRDPGEHRQTQTDEEGGRHGVDIQVKFFALARDLAGSAEAVIHLAEGATVGQAWQEIVRTHPGLDPYREEFLLAVNRRFASPDHTLAPGDVLAVIPPVSGGDHYRVTPAPLDVQAAVDAVRHPEAGAIVLFVGTVRELTGETRTVQVDYEAYPEMAEDQLAAVGQEIRQRWDVRGIHVVHRQGRLQPGEDSVVIAVSAPHRADAFAACRHAIDRIKEIVPIWKQETTTEGSRWVRREG